MGLLDTLSMSSVVSATQDQISSSLGNEEVILHLQSGTYYGLNEVASRIWALLKEPRTIGDIQSALLEEYEVDPAQCQRDLFKLLQNLADERLIEVKDAAVA